MSQPRDISINYPASVIPAGNDYRTGVTGKRNSSAAVRDG